MAGDAAATTEVFKVLGDPMRWEIVQRIAAEAELACRTLEDELPVSKPTISYHTKLLTQAGLIEVHKRGRHYFYRLRREALDAAIGELRALTADAGSGETARLPRAVGDTREAAPSSIVTW